MIHAIVNIPQITVHQFCSDANIALVAMSAVMQQGAPSNPQNSGTSVQPLMTAAMSIAGSAISVDHMPAGFVTVESKGFY